MIALDELTTLAELDLEDKPDAALITLAYISSTRLAAQPLASAPSNAGRYCCINCPHSAASPPRKQRAHFHMINRLRWV